MLPVTPDSKPLFLGQTPTDYSHLTDPKTKLPN